MYALITDDRSGEELARYALADADLLDCDLYAERYASEIDYSLAQPDGYIITGCADFTVTLQEDPGSVICWNSKSYFLEVE